jgi:muramoyltetrapeptide carboxypeptidase
VRARVAPGLWPFVAERGGPSMRRGALRRPAVLRPGMRVGVVAPASPVRELALVERGVAMLEELGFAVEVAVDPLRRRGYLAGTDAERAAALLHALGRPDLDAILCLRGGDGTMRTLLAMDPVAVRGLADVVPKPVIGFSDITMLHAFLGAELRWTSYYGPGLTSLAEATPYTLDHFARALLNTAPYDVTTAPGYPDPMTVVGGRAEGLLAGGCLSLVVTLLGTPWELDLDGRILFFEDLNEAPYRIDRMLTQLLAAGHLQRCTGIVVGEHVNCEARDPATSLTFDQVVRDLLAPLGVPVVAGLPLGHGRNLATVPLGQPALLDADAGLLRVALSP